MVVQYYQLHLGLGWGWGVLLADDGCDGYWGYSSTPAALGGSTGGGLQKQIYFVVCIAVFGG